MTTRRHPAYLADQALTGDTWITSTAAAQGLGVSLPVFDTHYRDHLTVIPATERRGVRFHSREVREMRDSLDRLGAEVFFDQLRPEDPLGPAKGILTAIVIGAGLVALAIGVYVVTR